MLEEETLFFNLLKPVETFFNFIPIPTFCNVLQHLLT